ncbi:MAG: FkbM family methyltransferase [Anaerolineae bacterium]|nr:FkbM family methyltransferase [Anaerolineae bacterium]
MSHSLRDQLTGSAPRWMRASPLIQRVFRTLWPALRKGTFRDGVAVGLHFDVGPGNPVLLSGRVERPVQQALAEQLKPGQTVYDIGANVGFFTVLAAYLVGVMGMVYAFEPVPDNARTVRVNASLNGFQHIKVVEKAAADHAGRETLILARDAGGAMLESTNERPPDATREITVELIRIDDMVSAGTLRPPDFIKIDVEGAEMSVLRGMQQTMRDHRPVVLFEVDAEHAPDMERKYAECAELLGGCGYDVERLQDAYAHIPWSVAHGLARPRGD